MYFETLCNNIKICDIHKNNFNDVTNNFTSIANATFQKILHQTKQAHGSDIFTSPLQKLKDDNMIIITKADKGRGNVTMSKSDYQHQMFNILKIQNAKVNLLIKSGR